MHKNIETLKKEISQHANSSIASDVLECLLYIRDNSARIIAAVDEQKGFKDESDKKKNVLRDRNGMSFHLNGFRNGKEAVENFSMLLAQVDHAIGYLIDLGNPIYIQLYIANIRDNDRGCMNDRLCPANDFAFEVERNGGALTLDSLVQKFQQDVITPNNIVDDKKVLSAALDFFSTYLDLKYPISDAGVIKPLTRSMVKQYLTDLFDYSEATWIALFEDLKKPDHSSFFTDKHAISWYDFQFLTKEHAERYLNLIKMILPEEYQQSIAKARVKSNRTGYRFRISETQFLAYTTLLENKAPTNTPEKYLIKTIRGDERNFFREFVHTITPSKTPKIKKALRQPKKSYTVKAEGVEYTLTKKHSYPKEQKQAYSQLQSTSLTTSQLKTPAFGLHTPRKNNLVGVSIDVKDALLGRLFLQDIGTIARPYDFYTRKEAEAYHSRMMNKGKPLLFSNLDAYEKALLDQDPQQRSHNEVMARLKWNKDGTSQVRIFNDTLEARLLAQDYARILKLRLKEQARENEEIFNEDYNVPISFYLVDNEEKHNTAYTAHEQEADKKAGIEIYHNETLRNKKIMENNYEFLLAPDDIHTIRHAQYKDVPLILHILSEGYVHIARSLIEKDEQKNYEQFFQNLNSTQYRFQIHHAIEHATRCGDEFFVNLLLEITNEKPYDFERFFHIAAWSGHINLVQLFLAKSENKIESESILSAFKNAANTGHRDVADLLLQQAGDIREKDKFFRDRETQCLKIIIDKNPALFAHDPKWFYLTIIYSLEEAAEKLLAAGVDINTTCCPSHVTTPLNQSIEHENTEMLNWLLSKGADANAAMLKLPMQYHAAHSTARPYIYASYAAISLVVGMFLVMDGFTRGQSDPNKRYQSPSTKSLLEFGAGFFIIFAAVGLLMLAGRKQANEWWKLHFFYSSFGRYLDSLFPMAVNLPNQEMFSLVLQHANTSSGNRILRDLGEIVNPSSSSFGFFACIARKQALSEKKTAEKFVAILEGSDTVVLDKGDYSALARARFSQIFQPAPPLTEIRVDELEEQKTENIKEPLLLMRGG